MITKRTRAYARSLPLFACAMCVVYVLVRTGSLGRESVKEEGVADTLVLEEGPKQGGNAHALVQETTTRGSESNQDQLRVHGTSVMVQRSVTPLQEGPRLNQEGLNQEGPLLKVLTTPTMEEQELQAERAALTARDEARSARLAETARENRDIMKHGVIGSLMAAPATGVEKACKETYGFLPCSESVGGSIFLMFAYGAVLMFAATCIGDGGEALLEMQVLPPAVIGGLLLPILGAIPDAVIVFVSGMARATKIEVERKIAVGVGTLSGSTIMLLCVALPSSLFLGRCDLADNNDGEGPQAVDQVLDGEPADAHRDGYCKGFNLLCQHLFKTGITHDASVLRIKWFMVVTSLGYLVVQGQHSRMTQMLSIPVVWWEPLSVLWVLSHT